MLILFPIGSIACYAASTKMEEQVAQSPAKYSTDGGLLPRRLLALA